VSGGAFCWGLDQDGQVGDGTRTTAILTPTPVVGLASGVSDISTGWNFSCAVVQGAAMCWGDNASGTLGNGSNADSSVPVQVAGLESGVTRVVANVAMACAIVNGGVKCWGNGPAGTSAAPGTNAPVGIDGLDSGVVDITLGYDFACATTSDRKAHCWGANDFGEFGNGNYEGSQLPVTVALTGLDPTTWSAGTAHTCALMQGSAYCWGSNDVGQLGIGSELESPMLPNTVHGLPAPVEKIRIGSKSACAISSGRLYCWGANNHGQLGNGTNLPQGAAVAVDGLDAGVSDVAVYGEHTCAIAHGGAYCWGDNDDGQLGDGTSETRWTPAPVYGLEANVQAIAVGLDHSCAIVNGGVKCWGSSLAFGDGVQSTGALEPVDVAGLGSGVTAIAAGSHHTCAVVNGAAKCWGSNSHGQLGDGGATSDYAPEPVQVVGLTSGVTAIAAGGSTTCAIVNGGAKCWGQNDYGELGIGNNRDSNVPMTVWYLASGVLSITVGHWHTCAMTTTGEKCWGNGAFGDLGTGYTISWSTPVDVTTTPSGTESYSAGRFATCAIADGAGICWGYNNAGQIGTGGVPWLPAPSLRASDAIFASGFDR
jgi:alpha-tubulin suppressor-like RCC1 family protein